MCNKINEIVGYSPEICVLKYYNHELSKIYEKDEVDRRVFQMTFYNTRSLLKPKNKR